MKNPISLALWSAALLLASPAATAPTVQPSDRVVTRVVVRSAPTTGSAPLDRLEPGEVLEFLGEVPGWNQVRLPDGRTGYVSKQWTMVLEEAAAGGFNLHFVDVGTGLAIFVEGPDFNLLYDGGSNDDAQRGAGNRLIAYLRHARPSLARIDHLILSHPHKDHVELLPDVLATYQVSHVWDSGRNNPTCGYRAFLERVAAEPGVTYHAAVSGPGPHTAVFPQQSCYGGQQPARTLSIPHTAISTAAPAPLGAGAQMTILHADAAPHSSPNENSLVVRLDLGSRRVLLMGDAEAGGRKDPSDPPDPDSIEGKLLACCAAALRADILVAGHHGSKTSSRALFLDAVNADTFIVSAGPMKYSTVTLPDQVIVEELDRRGTVWRTDLGDADCRTDPSKIGSDADGRAGGCDNIRIDIGPTGVLTARYDRAAD